MRRSAVFGSSAASTSIASSSGRTSTPAASGIAGMSEAPERPGALADAPASLVFAAFLRSKGEASVKSPSAESALEKASTLFRAARRSSSVKRPFASFFQTEEEWLRDRIPQTGASQGSALRGQPESPHQGGPAEARAGPSRRGLRRASAFLLRGEARKLRREEARRLCRPRRPEGPRRGKRMT